MAQERGKRQGRKPQAEQKKARDKGRDRAAGKGKRQDRKKRSGTGREPRKKGPELIHFAASFRHYITGVVYYARDYGHGAWPIRRKAA
jgi:hypothetical protein